MQGPPGGFVPPMPGMVVMSGDEFAKSQINAPAICLAIGSGLSMLWYLFASAVVVFAGGLSLLQSSSSGDVVPGVIGGAIGAAMYLFWAVCAGVVLVGALRMRKLRGYNFAMVSSILAIVPCTTYVCCMFMMPFGIWCLVVLMKPEVKAAFR